MFNKNTSHQFGSLFFFLFGEQNIKIKESSIWGNKFLPLGDYPINFMELGLESEWKETINWTIKLESKGLGDQS